MQNKNDSSFDTQAFIDLINKVQASSGSYNWTYLCYSEPSEYVKDMIKSSGGECKVVGNKFIASDVDVDTAFILPTHCLPIKVVGEQNENN